MITCPQCGTPTIADNYSCTRCFGSPTDPVMWPHARTYGVTGIGIAAAAAIGIAVLIGFVTALSPLAAAQTAQAGDVSAAYTFVLLATVLDVGLQVVVATLLIIWMWRARTNLDAFPNGGGVMSAGWTIGAWVIPFANLVLTSRIMHGLAVKTLRRQWAAVLAVVWAVTFWGGSWLSQFFVPDAPDTTAASAHAQYLRTTLLSGYLVEWGLMAIAGVCLIVLIVAISRTQTARIARGRATAWQAQLAAAAQSAQRVVE